MTEDAALALVLRPGMVLRSSNWLQAGDDDDSGALFLCVANLDWAVLSWPLKFQADGLLHLDGQGKLNWHFVWKLDQYEAAVAEPVLNGDNCISLKAPDWQPAVVCMLRTFSHDLVFRELAVLAELGFSIQSPNSYKREDLLHEMATKATNDLEFAKAVLANEAATKSQKQKSSQVASSDDFAELLIDNMDAEDQQEFRRDFNITQKEKLARKKQWQQWRQEGLEDLWLLLVKKHEPVDI